MSTDQLKARAILVMLGLVIAGLSTACFGYDYEWLAGDGIDGVDYDDISMTDPSVFEEYRHNLHCDLGFVGAEEASFEIDIADASDIDKCWDPDVSDWVYEDAGIHEDSTEWDCQSCGDIDDGGIATTFTPSSTPWEDIEISCRLHEGHSLSYSDGNYDDPTYWFIYEELIDTFKVGVTMSMPPFDPIRLYEDETGYIGIGVSLSSLVCEIDWTGILNRPGEVLGAGSAGITREWTAVATTGGDIDIDDGVMRGINFIMLAEGSGRVRICGGCNGIPTGLCGVVASVITACCKPWAAPFVGITFYIVTPDERTNSKFAYLASLVIEDVDTTSSGDVNSWCVKNAGVESYDYDFNDLDTAGELTDLAVNDVIRSAVQLKTKIRVYDYSITAGGVAWALLFDDPSLYFKATLPKYW